MTDLQARAEAAADAVGEAIQKAWDVCPTLPAIDLDEAERTALGKAAAMAALQSEGWRPISEAKVWVVCVVTDGKQVAIAQKALDDWGGEYWAVDPEDGLDWEPTLWMPHPYDAVLPAPPEEEGV